MKTHKVRYERSRFLGRSLEEQINVETWRRQTHEGNIPRRGKKRRRGPGILH
jgi:hypothetical protein